ncbi:MAG: RIP metalloprotease RseP [Bacteroidota bacterium]|nr:RIP metalloprotease RseP [Bacteroidota bacterium]
MNILIQIAQLLLSLSILVIFHEMGHFVAARIFKTRVEKFYLFFNPWFSIFKFNYKGTQYGLGWLPLGGYVKISGMIDESLDKEQLRKPAQPWEFRAKPAWQRLIIMLGGVIVNVLLAMVIYVFMLYTWGEQYLPTTEANKYGIAVDSLGYEMGLRDGDQIISIDKEVVEDFQKIPLTIILNEANTIHIIRQGEPFTVNIPEGFLGKLAKQRNPNFISIRIPYVVDSITPESPALQAGIQKEDRFIGLNDEALIYFNDYLREMPNYKNQEITFKIIRGNDTLNYPVVVSDQGKIGVYAKGIHHYFDIKELKYSFAEAIPAGIAKGFRGIGNYLRQLKLLFSKEVKAYESVGGFITIGRIFPEVWDWQQFWRLTAFLSIMLAILNILPIPALDGGHVMFLLYEILFRRKPNEKFLEYAQIVGMILLFGLLIFANGNDIIRLFRQ